MYHEYDSASDLQDRVERALARWVYDHRPGIAQSDPPSPVDEHLDAHLLCLLAKATETVLALGAALQVREAVVLERVARLRERGLVTTEGEALALGRSTEAFLQVVSVVSQSDEFPTLMRTAFYSTLLERSLRGGVESRFHVSVNDELGKVLWRVALASPGVSKYLLFGDTSLYDAMVDAAAEIGRLEFAQGIAEQQLLHSTCLRYANDAHAGAILQDSGPNIIEGQVVHMTIKGADEHKLLFKVATAIPSIRVRAREAIKRGALLSAEKGFQTRTGIILFHLQEYELAANDFRRLLAEDLAPAQLADALNSLGACLLALGDLSEARSCFERALDLAPDFELAAKNLNRVLGLAAPDALRTPTL